MAHSPADKRRVFLAYRTVFTGPSAHIRKSKKVREVIQQHKNSFQVLIKDVGFDNVLDILKTLLDQRVFESELKAKIVFPELFLSTPARDVQRNASENDAVRSVAEVLEELSSASERGEPCNDNTNDNVPRESVAAINLSLYPSYLPYSIQHLILTTVQRQLEDCCYDFTAKWLPSLLKDNKWDCAEAVELTKWTRTLAKHCGKLPAGAFASNQEAPLNETFSSTNVLRHTAVHRIPTTAQGIHKMIQFALRLANTLNDHSRAADLENLCLEIGSRIRDMELNKNFLENRLDEQLQTINRQRAELDKKEQESIAAMLKENQENKLLIGSFLEDAVNSTFGKPMIGSVQLPTMAEGAHESNGIVEDDEHDKIEGARLSNGDIDTGKSA